MKPNRGARFDQFMKMSYGQAAQERPSNEEIRQRNLADYAADLAAEEKTNAEAAALAARDAEEERLGISDTMNAIRAKDAREAERLQRVWNRPFENLAVHAENKGEYALDRFHTMVIGAAPCERPPEDVDNVAAAFFTMLEEEGTVLTLDDKRRILLYVGLNGIGFAEKGVFIDPMANGTWIGALARLEELGAVKPKRQSRTEPKPLEITDSSDAAHDRMVVSREIERLVVGSNGWFDNWVASLATGFNFYPTEEQLANAARWLEHRSANLFSADTYNDCRKSLVRQNIWPSHLLTKDEQVEILVEKYNTNDPKQREQFRLEKNRILFGTA